VNKRTAKNFHVWNNIVSLLHNYSRQRRTIDSFLATDGRFVYMTAAAMAFRVHAPIISARLTI